MKNWLLIIIWSLFLGYWSLAGAVNGVTQDPSRVLFTARQLGMGGVAVNFADDASGIFSNPAGLVGIEFPQLTTSSRKLFLDETQYLLAGWTMPTNYGIIGLGYAGMGIGGSLPTVIDPTTKRITLDPSKEAGSYSSSVLAVSYSRRLPILSGIAVGGNLKFYNQSLSGGGYSDRGTGTGLDLGATFKPLPWLSAGAVLQNIVGGTVKWTGSEDKANSCYKAGVAADISQQLRAGADLELPNIYHLGLEYILLKNVFLRAGLNQETAGSGLALGLGLVNGGFRFDYAYIQRPGLPGDNPHYFSLSYIGERIYSEDLILKKKVARLMFHAPKDRLVTDLDSINISAEARADKIIEQKRIWTVTAVSATYDAFELSVPEKLAQVFLNGKPIEKHGTAEAIEDAISLGSGRNIVQLVGFTTPEITVGSAEIRVLRVTPFTDTPVSFWAADPVYLNVTLGLVTGYPDNTFQPDKGITRAELVTLLVKSLGAPQDVLDSYGSIEVFSDVQLDNWAAKFIAYGSALRFVSGYPDGTFSSNKVLNRAEGIAILARYAGLPEETTISTPPFPDLKLDFWANKHIAPAKTTGLLKYLEGKEFKPGENFTRAEACEVLYRVPSIQKKVEEFWTTGLVTAASSR